jgi:hypothetical protein
VTKGSWPLEASLPPEKDLTGITGFLVRGFAAAHRTSRSLTAALPISNGPFDINPNMQLIPLFDLEREKSICKLIKMILLLFLHQAGG